MQLVRQLAQFIAATNYESIPQETVDVAKERLLDTLGAMYAGCSGWDFTRQLYEACSQLGTGEARILGIAGRGFPYATAALANSALAHSVELDDGHRNAGCHAGAAVVPTALMIGAAQRSTPREMIAAIVLGYDIEYRIATNVTPALIYKSFHPSTACGMFGAMAAAGKLLGLDEEQLANGLGLAGAFTGGLKQTTKSAPQVKGIMVGNSAAGGVNAAFLARSGLTGPLEILEGPAGIFKVMSENVDESKVVSDFGRHFLIHDTYTKLYPTCRHTHPAIEGSLELMAEGVRTEDIETVEIGGYRICYETTGKIYEPRNAGEAKFSTPFCVSVALREGCMGTSHLAEEFLRDPQLLEMARRVKVVIDPDIERMFPKIRGSRITFNLKNGESKTTSVFDLKGSPAKPASWPDLTSKFRANAAGSISKGAIESCIALIEGFDKTDTADELFQLIFPK